MRKTLLLLLPVIPIALLSWVLSESGEQLPGFEDARGSTSASPYEELRGSSPEERQGGAEPVRTEFPAADPANPLNPAILSGVVVDEAGLLVPDVPLMVTPNGSSMRSGEDGTFFFRRRGSANRGARIRMKPESWTAFRILSEDQLFEWGTEGIRIVVSRPQTWVLSVVEEGTGAPVEAFDWRCTPLSPSSYQRKLGWGEHPGGRAAMQRLEYGKHRLLVFPEDEDLVPSRPVEFEVGQGSGELRIEVQRRRPLTVRVLRGDGTPVQGTEVELLRSEGTAELTLASVTGPADINFTGHSAATILDGGETNAWGEVVLRGPLRENFAVKALGPGHAPELVPDVSIGEHHGPLVINVLTGATLTGTLRPVRVLESINANLSQRERGQDRPRPGLFLSGESAGSRLPIARNETVAIQPDGSFHIEEVPPGSWEVFLSYWEFIDTGSGDLGYPTSHRLASVRDLKEGETRQVTLDVSQLVPGRVTGQIYLDGQPYAQGKFGLHSRETDPNGRSFSSRAGFVTDAEGRFSTEIPAGWVSAFVSLGQVGGGPFVLSLLGEQPAVHEVGVPIDSIEQLHVLPGQTAIGVFHLVHRRMRVRLLEHDGAPATERYFLLHSDGRTIGPGDLRTTAEGWLVVDPAPDYPFGFYTWPKRMDQLGTMQLSQEERNQLMISVGPVQIPTGTREAEFTLRLPDDGR